MDERHHLGYQRWLQNRGLAPNTVTQRTRFAHMADRRIGDLSVATTSDLLSWLSGYDGWTRFCYHKALTSVLDYLVATQIRPDHPLRIDGVRKPKQPKPVPNPLTLAEENLVLLRADHRQLVWLLLGLRQGLRAHEIAKVRGEDVTARAFTVVGKGAKTAVLPTHPDVWVIAQRMPASGWWFPSPRSRSGHIYGSSLSISIGKLYKTCGITDRGSIHRARATFGTTLARNGTPLHVVQQLLRHESLASTQHYLGVDPDELAAAIRCLGPGSAA